MKKYSVFALYLFLGETFVRALGFFANAYIARTLNPEILGFIAVGSSLLNSSILVSDSGLRTLGFLETSKKKTTCFFSFSEILTTKIVHGILMFSILCTLTFFLYNTQILKIICIFYLFNIIYDALFLDWYYNGLQKFKIVASARIVTSISYVFLLTIYVKTPSDVLKIPMFFFLANMVSVTLLGMFLSKTSITYNLSFSIQKYFAVLKHSIPLGLGTFFNQIPLYLPPILLERFVNSKETGYFWVAFKIVSLMMILDKTFSTIFLSTLPRMWFENIENAKKNLQSILHFAIAIGFLSSLLISLLSNYIITLFFGSSYSESYIVLSIMSWFFTLTLINSIFVYGLIAIDQKKVYLRAVAIGFFINCMLITLLIFFFKKFGASIAVVIGELIFVILCYREFNKFSSLTFYRPFLKACIASIVSMTITKLTHFSIILNSLLAAAIFVILTLVLRIIQKNDISLLMTKWKKN